MVIYVKNKKTNGYVPVRSRIGKDYPTIKQSLMNKQCKIIARPVTSSSKNTYIEKINGRDAVRIKRGVSFEESSKEFKKAVKQGKMVCLSDWMINAGM